MVKMSLAKQVKYNNKIIPAMEIFNVNDEDVAIIQKLGGFIHPEEVVAEVEVKTPVKASKKKEVKEVVIEIPVLPEAIEEDVSAEEPVAIVEPVVTPEPEVVEKLAPAKPGMRSIQPTLLRTK